MKEEASLSFVFNSPPPSLNNESKRHVKKLEFLLM